MRAKKPLGLDFFRKVVQKIVIGPILWKNGQKWKSFWKSFSFDFSGINPIECIMSQNGQTLKKSCSKCCKIFKVWLTILGHYALKGYSIMTNNIAIDVSTQTLYVLKFLLLR